MSYHVGCNGTIYLKPNSCSEEFDLIENIANEYFDCAADISFSFQDREGVWSWNDGDVHKVSRIDIDICYYNYHEDDVYKFYKLIEPYIDEEKGAVFFWDSLEEDCFWKDEYSKGEWKECNGVKSYEEGKPFTLENIIV